MKITYLKVTNWYLEDGSCTYQGLDISSFIPGSQFYPDGQNVCYIGTKQEDFVLNENIEVVTKEEVLAIKEEYLATLPPSLEQQIKDVKSENAQMMLALVMNDLI